MGIVKRILGICETRPPRDGSCWTYRNGQVELELDRVPELAAEGGAIRLEGGGLPHRILVVHGLDGTYHAFVNRCSHAGRRIDPKPGAAEVQCCSVMKSTYDYAGNVISGGAKKSLPVLDARVEEGKLLIAT